MSEYTNFSAWVRRWLTTCILPNKGVISDGHFRPTSSTCHHQTTIAGDLTERQDILLKRIQTRSIPTKSVRERPLYDNCLLLSQDGKPLSRCSWRKATWYLRNGLASCTVQEGEEMRVQLKFRPKERSRGLVGQFYLQKKRQPVRGMRSRRSQEETCCAKKDPEAPACGDEVSPVTRCPSAVHSLP